MLMLNLFYLGLCLLDVVLHCIGSFSVLLFINSKPTKDTEVILLERLGVRWRQEQISFHSIEHPFFESY
jgi:hypothetical protein